MKYAFYPGCVSRGGCPELYPAAVKVLARLEIDLVELKDVRRIMNYISQETVGRLGHIKQI
ncbi:MAG: hypothetical protein IIB11_07855 [Chloroflexi bacterium]|nr:hypothetical protein [Chloroflexota bacterium]